MHKINSTIMVRRDSSAGWASRNPILFEGEPGYERGTGILKIGDGRSRWLDLVAFIPGGGGVGVGGQASDAEILAHINSTAPHPIYDEGPSLLLLYQNAKV